MYLLGMIESRLAFLLLKCCQYFLEISVLWKKMGSNFMTRKKKLCHQLKASILKHMFNCDLHVLVKELHSCRMLPDIQQRRSCHTRMR